MMGRLPVLQTGVTAAVGRMAGKSRFFLSMTAEIENAVFALHTI